MDALQHAAIGSAFQPIAAITPDVCRRSGDLLSPGAVLCAPCLHRMTQPRRDHADCSPIVERKTRRFFSVPLDATVLQAPQGWPSTNVGASVGDGGESLRGIFSERDYARRVVLLGKTLATTLVGEIMTNKVLGVGPEHTVDQCMAR